MPEIDPVIIQLKIERQQALAALRDQTSRVEQSLGRQERSVISLERQFERSSGAISSKLRLLAGTFAGAFSAREITGLIDGFTRLQNSLRVAGLEGEALASVQERLRQIGATYGVEIEALGSVFSRATLAQKELGASTEEIIRLNEIIAAGLKVTGTSSQQASGALLQLGQALGSDVVRGEEFNSILEGALPIAQAAARGIDRFGGSVAKLRTEVVNGNVTSKEFFDGILRGGVETIAQAERATLTLSGALTVLRNELTLYVGEAARSNGLTAALSSGITALAQNLDTVGMALSIIAAALLGRYAAGVAVAVAGNIKLAATATGATTAMGRLAATSAVASRSLLALFGGPVGLAITAFTVAIGYAVAETLEFNDSMREMAGGLEEAEGKLEQARARAEKAGVAVNSLKKQTDAATTSIHGIAGALVDAARQAIAFGNSAKFAAIAAAQLRRVQALETAEKADRVLQTRSGIFGGANEFLQTNIQGLESTRVLEAARNNARATVKLVEEELALLAATPDKAFEEVTGGGGGGVVSKPDKAKKERAARQARMTTTAEFDEELRRLASEELQDRLALTTDIAERAQLQDNILGLERQSRVAAIQNDESLNSEQKKQLIALTNLRYGIDEHGNQVTNWNKSGLNYKEEMDRLADQAEAALRDEIRTAESGANLLTSRQERLAAERRILALVEQEERNALERAIASDQVRDATRARANLEQQQAARRIGTDRQFESPLQRYRREVEEGTSNIGDAYEEIAIDGVRTLNSELANTVKNVLGLNGALGNTVAKLIEIALQKGAFDLLGSLFGGGKASASDTAVSSALSIASQFIPGRASGGYAGSLVRVNEGASPGRVEGFMPNGGGQIIPLGRMNAMSPQQAGGGTSTIRLELSGDIDARMKSVAAGVSIEVVRTAAPMIREQAAKDVASMNRPRI